MDSDSSSFSHLQVLLLNPIRRQNKSCDSVRHFSQTLHFFPTSTSSQKSLWENRVSVLSSSQSEISNQQSVNCPFMSAHWLLVELLAAANQEPASVSMSSVSSPSERQISSNASSDRQETGSGKHDSVYLSDVTWYGQKYVDTRTCPVMCKSYFLTRPTCINPNVHV